MRVTDVALSGLAGMHGEGADLRRGPLPEPRAGPGRSRRRAQRRLRARADPFRGGHRRVALRGDDPRGDAAHAGQHRAAGAARARVPRHGAGPGGGPGPAPAPGRRAVREPPRGLGRRLGAADPAALGRGGAAAGPVLAERAEELDRVPPAVARPDRRGARGASRLPRRQSTERRAAAPSRGSTTAAPAAGRRRALRGGGAWPWGPSRSCSSSSPSPRGRCGSSAC